MLRSELVKKLELVGRALADNSMVPIFQCFMFNRKTVTCYNDQLGLIAPCPTDDAFAVNGKTLLGLLTNSQSEEVQFQLGEELEVKAGKSRFKLPYQTEDAFLFQPPDEAWEVTVELNGELIAGLQACLLTSSKDVATQPALVGVCLKHAETLYSCDGDALSRYTVFPNGKSKVLADFMMPNPFCETVLKVEQPEKLELNRGWAKASFGGGVVIYGRLIENDHPLDHEDLIKKTIKGGTSFAPIPEDLDHALSRARIVADPESKPTQLTVEGGKLHLLTDTHLGVVRDVLPFKHPDVKALVSPELMQRSIGNTTEMSIMGNCSCFKDGERLFQLLSNYG